MTIWFISDTHFGHTNILTFRDRHGLLIRPFPTIEDHDECIVKEWNAVVRPQDHIYHLGDVSMRPQPMDAILPRLTGHKRLIRGNHDIFQTKRYLRYFQEIHATRVLDGMIFTHIPLHPTAIERFKANIHGHTHAEGSPPGKYLSLCPEIIGYRPLSLEEILQLVKEKQT